MSEQSYIIHNHLAFCPSQCHSLTGNFLLTKPVRTNNMGVSGQFKPSMRCNPARGYCTSVALTMQPALLSHREGQAALVASACWTQAYAKWLSSASPCQAEAQEATLKLDITCYNYKVSKL